MSAAPYLGIASITSWAIVEKPLQGIVIRRGTIIMNAKNFKRNGKIVKTTCFRSSQKKVWLGWVESSNPCLLKEIVSLTKVGGNPSLSIIIKLNELILWYGNLAQTLAGFICKSWKLILSNLNNLTNHTNSNNFYFFNFYPKQYHFIKDIN